MYRDLAMARVGMMLSYAVSVRSLVSSKWIVTHGHNGCAVRWSPHRATAAICAIFRNPNCRFSEFESRTFDWRRSDSPDANGGSSQSVRFSFACAAFALTLRSHSRLGVRNAWMVSRNLTPSHFRGADRPDRYNEPESLVEFITY